MTLNRKKIADMRLMLVRSGGGLLDSPDLCAELASGNVLGELLALADAALKIRAVHRLVAPLGDAARGAMLDLDALEEGAGRGPDTPSSCRLPAGHGGQHERRSDRERDLEQEVERLRRAVRRIAPATCYWEEQKRMFPDGDYVKCSLLWPDDDGEWCPGCIAEKVLA